MKKIKINLSFLRNLNKKKKKSLGEIRQETLTSIANKWKKQVGIKGLSDQETKEHPLFCKHEHCAYWRLNRLSGFERKTGKLDKNDRSFWKNIIKHLSAEQLTKVKTLIVQMKGEEED